MASSKPTANYHEVREIHYYCIQSIHYYKRGTITNQATTMSTCMACTAISIATLGGHFVSTTTATTRTLFQLLYVCEKSYIGLPSYMSYIIMCQY